MAVQEEINIEAVLNCLDTIKLICNSFNECAYCPFRATDIGGCKFITNKAKPKDWKINYKYNWRAFKDMED